ncbi:MAG TPA: type 1 glutamine amidotransferase [Bauldia sp.]|nr:type 1 glutamine amidotransferase [Bauldia sp.]
MRVLIVENYRATPAGLVGKALEEAGAEIDVRSAHLGAPLPSETAGYDGIVILGGEQNALADDVSPWFPSLLDLTRRFGEENKAVLGICLGSQLVARAWGGENVLARPVEFGWHEVRPTEAGRVDPVLAALGKGSPVFHWHEDTFTLPDGAVHLAASEMTELQAFRIGRAVYGIQFHFEADCGLVAQWSEEFAPTIRGYAPDWAERHPLDAARFGPRADRTGLDLARRWTRLVKPTGSG